MSVQAGIWNFDGRLASRQLLEDMSETLGQAGPDGEYRYADGPIGLLYRPFHTTAESRVESQPHRSARGFIVTWDGRLDNRDDLVSRLRNGLASDATDVAIIAAAFESWGTSSFKQLIGDWALCIWNPLEQEILLACDYMAVRHVFYHLKKDRIWWATDPTPLVLLSGDKFQIDEDYIAGYCTGDCDSHITPYREIRQVPAGQFARVRNGRCSIERYWRFSPSSRIRYRTDGEYEEHFRYVFRQSVRRRLRSDTPVLAELSGGLDSSSVVCMADAILSHEGAQTPHLDTLSFYDRTEPKGDDWVYFQTVEQKRGSVGKHIDVSDNGKSKFFSYPEFTPFPGYWGLGGTIESEHASFLQSRGYRVTLSGIGGDEFMGGIPNPSALLADLIVQFKLPRLARQIVAWSLIKRRPCIQLLGAALLNLVPAFLVQYFLGDPGFESWFERAFIRRTRIAIRQLRVHEHFGLWMPTRRSCIRGVLLMANKLAKQYSRSLPQEEFRYPYLDQTLIEFVLSIPADQLLRPGETRSLMRRALVGIVPPEVLSRRTKQFAARTPIVALSNNRQGLLAAFDSPIMSRLGILHRKRFVEKLYAASIGNESHIVRMLRTISLELWLKDLASRGLVDLPTIDAPALKPDAVRASA